MSIHFKKILNSLMRRRERKDIFRNPSRDWHILLAVSTVAVLINTAWHYSLYSSFDVIQVSSGDSTKKLTLKRGELEKAISSLNRKQKAHQELLYTRPSTIDPS